MFATFKKIFGMRADTVADSPAGSHTITAPAAAPRPAYARVASSHPESTPRPAGSVVNATGSLSIPLASVLGRLPAELNQRIRQMDVGEAQVSIPVQKVLSQIAHGSVRIPFGELRHISPPGTFTSETDRDRVLVDLPLHEILTRLDPILISRRPAQKQVVVPPEVTGPFGGQMKVTFSTAPLKPNASSQTPPSRAQTPQPPIAPPVAPSVASAPPQQYAPPPVTPLSPIAPIQPIASLPPRPQVAPIAQSAPKAPVIPPARYGNGNGIANGNGNGNGSYGQTPMPLRGMTPAAPKSDLDEPFFKKIPTRPAAPSQPPPPPAAPSAIPSPFSRVQPPVSPKPEAPRAFVPPAPLAPVTPLAPAAPIVPISPLAPTVPTAPVVPVSPLAPAPISTISPIAPSAPVVPVAAAQMAPITPIAPEPEPVPVPIPFQPAPEPAPAPAPVAPAAPAETRFLTVPLSDLSQGWPEAMQHEITAHHLSGVFLALPFGVIELAMKQGRIALPWRVIRSWIKPQIVMAASAQDATVLELPLKVVTPLFLAELRGNKVQKKIQIDEDIPDLFSGGRAPEAPAQVAPPVPVPPPMAAPAPVTLPSAKPTATDTNYFGKRPPEGQPEEAAPVVKKGPTPGTAFLVRYATPNEIVSKAAALDGVDGALIALPDGLLVASHIPPTMNGDTIAAFLPQIFSRVTQCTKELRLGDLNNLSFTVGSVPWKIFRVGAIYFAAFGRPGEPLPTAQLAGIAGELDRKAK